MKQQTVVVSSQPSGVSQAEIENSRLKLDIESLKKQVSEKESVSKELTTITQENVHLKKQV